MQYDDLTKCIVVPPFLISPKQIPSAAGIFGSCCFFLNFSNSIGDALSFAIVRPPPQRIHHSPTSQEGITPHRMGVSLAHGGQHIISQDYQINHSTHPFWYSRNWNGYDNDYCDVCAIWDPISDDNLSSRDPFHANQTNPKKIICFQHFLVLKVQSF